MQYRTDVGIGEFDDVCPSSNDMTVVKTLDVKKGERVLEIGCGTGIFSVCLAMNGCEVSSFNTDPSAVECIRENAKKNGVQVNVKEIDSFENAYGEYDTIILNFPNIPGDAEEIKHFQALMDQVPIYMKKDSRLMIITSPAVDHKVMKTILSDLVVKKKVKFQTASGKLQMIEVSL